MRSRSVAVLVLCGVVALNAQTPKPTFEVASVKRNVSGAPGRGGPTATTTTRLGGVFTATNQTLERLILQSYRTPRDTLLREDQLLGGPGWLRNDRFDITAKGNADVPRDQISLMVQSLLEERFKLVVSRDQQERDVYVLTRARSDGRLGPDLRPAVESDCPQQNPGEDRLAFLTREIATAKRPSGGAQPLLLMTCGTMAGLADSLTRTLGTTVTDKTDLRGNWHFVVPRPGENAAPGAARDPNPTGSLFTALQDSLGLKLEKRRGNVDVLVIDSVQQPTEN